MVFKEAINNVARHSGAASANVGAAFQGQRLELTIADDGRGFEVDGKHATSMGGNGVINMRRRIERLGGEIEFDSAPGEGTRVRIVVPLTLDGIASGVRKLFSAGGRN
jgi:signal transduction histidine kinase